MQPSSSALLNRLLARGKFRHVQVLLRIAELGSVQRTADAIGMTQSSVTQTLAYLEDLLGVRLFERHARGVRPTPACTDLLPVARQLMAGVVEGAEVVVARQLRGEGTVRLLGSASAVNGLLVDALPQFSERFPAVQVHLREAEGEDQLLAIAQGEVDLVACRCPPVIPEGWEFHAIREDRFIVVCGADHAAVRRRPRRWDELARETWVVLPAGLAARTRFDELAAAWPNPPRTYPVITRSLPLVWSLLRRGELLAFLPLNLARPLLDAGDLVELKVGPPSAIQPIGLLQPQAGLGSAASRLGEFLRGYQAPPAPRRGGKP